MAGLVREAMAAGAVGFATSHAITHNGYEGRPVPSRLAALPEIEALARAMRESGRGILQATVGPSLFLRQFEELARATGAPISWTALLTGQTGPGGHRKSLERTRSIAEAGLSIVPQVSGRPLNFDFDLDAPFPFEMLPLFKATMETDRAGRLRIYADPAFREAFKDLERGKPMRLAGWAKRTVVSLAADHPEWEERSVAELAEKAGLDPVDFLLDLGIESQLAARFRMAMFNYDEAEVAEVLADPNTVIGLSDAGAHANQVCDACFATDLLGRWVREKQALGWERAVEMLTRRPAEVFGITDRGLLALGRPADLVVFDPKTIGATRPKRVHDQPGGAPRLIVEATGIRAVVVNGTTVRDDGRDAVAPRGPLPGRLLRGGQA
jgi:N-acyl-D-aspartate/D-glutamate deacylase